MPNWCEDTLRITGSATERRRFLLRAGATLDFNKWKPYPEEYRLADEAAHEWEKQNPGFNWSDRPIDGFNQGGYEWCCENWGTKWNVESSRFDVQQRSVKCVFDTAWSPPLPVVQAMSQEFPTLKFVLTYSEKSSLGTGRWEFVNGVGRCLMSRKAAFCRWYWSSRPPKRERKSLMNNREYSKGQNVVAHLFTQGAWRICIPAVVIGKLQNGHWRLEDASGSCVDLAPEQVFPSQEAFEASIKALSVTVNTGTGRVTDFN